ncbi:hypothetical protein [Nocardia australiensis]|uniref:hypothetical protein n=1 Tax=Nocardia australiensis TaxID=2887191 RepID=UPI001D15B837|nr:hypothetical protein [Nocardia australiensis]
MRVFRSKAFGSPAQSYASFANVNGAAPKWRKVSAILGLYRNSQQARDLIRHLGPNTEFRRLWASSLDVNYGRDSDALLHVRDPTNGELVSYRLSIAPMVEDMTVLLVTAIPVSCLADVDS